MRKSSLNPSTVVTPPTNSQPWRHWLWAFDGYIVSTSLVFNNAIWMIYLATHGYSAFTIGLLEMLLHIAKFMAEVPTGIFADLIGRRKSLIVFCLLNALQCLLFLVATVPALIVSFVLCGVAFAFRGGADEAILWNLAGYADPQHHHARYGKLVTHMFLVMTIGEIISSSVGGYLGNILAALPFLAQAGVTLLGIIPLLFIPEQKTVYEAHEQVGPLRHLGKGLRAVWHNPTLMGLLLISGLVDGAATTIYFFYQLDLHGLGFSLSVIGLVVAPICFLQRSPPAPCVICHKNG